MRATPNTWRYLLPLMLLPAAVLVALALRQENEPGEDTGAVACQPATVSVDGTELLLQLVEIQEIQRQAQHQVDTLFE
jgi:hypothetical protein